MDARSNFVCIGVVYKSQGYTVGYNVGEGKKLSLIPKSPKGLKKQAHFSCLLKWEVGLRFVWTWLKDTHKILNVSYDTKKCVFIPSLQWHTALEK